MRRMAANPRCSGQSAVECALILPFLLLLIINVVNFGALFYAWISVANAARAGAQYYTSAGVSVSGGTGPSLSQVQALVSNELASLPNTASIQICVSRRATWLEQAVVPGNGAGRRPACRGYPRGYSQHHLHNRRSGCHLYLPADRPFVGVPRTGDSRHLAVHGSSPAGKDEGAAMSSRRHEERGAALVEFALVTMILLTVIIASVEFDRLLLVYTSLANAARALNPVRDCARKLPYRDR